MVDTSGVFHARSVHDTIRTWSELPLHTAVFTHGHIDHVFGVDLYEEEARTNGWTPPRVIAHTALNHAVDDPPPHLCPEPVHRQVEPRGEVVCLDRDIVTMDLDDRRRWVHRDAHMARAPP